MLGYDQDENGELKINEHEAKIVKLIFYMYLNGNTCQEIADTLTELGCKTKRIMKYGLPVLFSRFYKTKRHCGDVLARKTWTPNYLDHKSRKTIKTVINIENVNIMKPLFHEMISLQFKN